MITATPFLSVLCLVLIGAGSAVAAEDSGRRGEDPVPGPIPAQVVRVIDGDTIRVRAHIWLGQEVETNVRLAGVDTAEMRSHCDYERDMAHRATQFVEAALSDPSVTLLDIDYDKYGRRVVAHIRTATGQDLSEALMTAQLARRYNGGHKQKWCTGEPDSVEE